MSNPIERSSPRRPMERFERSLGRRLERFGKRSDMSAKTVNVKDLFDDGSARNSEGRRVTFNPHPPGSAEWLEHGQDHGVWVNGVSAQDFLLALDIGDNRRARFENATRFLSALSGSLQVLQDELVRMHSGGATPEQLMRFASKVHQTSGDTDFDTAREKLDHDLGRNKFGIPNVLRMLITEQPAEFEQKYLNKLDEFDGKRNRAGENQIWGLEAAFGDRIEEAQKSSGYQPADAFERERALSSERLKVIMDMSNEIATLPREARADAWARLEARLDSAYEAAEQEETPRVPPLTPSGDVVLPDLHDRAGFLFSERLGRAAKRAFGFLGYEESGGATDAETRRIFDDVWYA